MANWDLIKSKGRVVDRRGAVPLVGGISLTGVVLLVAFNLLTGGDLGDVVGQLNQLPLENTVVENTQEFEGEDDYEAFAAAVIGSNNQLWSEKFAQRDEMYRQPTLVLFRQATNSGCGTASSRVGPHYCSLDETIYLDETFFNELVARFGARGGDVAEAYVMAHEVGHHIQNLTGTLEAIQGVGGNSNEASVRLELQADCFAGIWAGTVRELGVLEPGEIREAMDAAAAVGDDRIQERATGMVNPETWTHGSSEQRVEWFNRGYESGSMDACDTFGEI